MPGVPGMKTLKTRFGDELEGLRNKGQERMRRRKTTPARDAGKPWERWKLRRASVQRGMQYFLGEYGLLSDENPWGCGRVSSEARRKHREGIARWRAWRSSTAGKSSGEQKPHERQRHETRPQGRAKINPSRVCERPRREGCPVGTGQRSLGSDRFAGPRTLKGRRTSREEPEGAIGSLLSWRAWRRHRPGSL